MKTQSLYGWPLSRLEVTGIFRSTSGNSSKLEVSSKDLTVKLMAAGRSLICSQYTPVNHGRARMSSSPPTLSPISSQNLKIVAAAAWLTGTSGGKTRCSFQSMILMYVSFGVSEQKGG